MTQHATRTWPACRWTRPSGLVRATQTPSTNRLWWPCTRTVSTSQLVVTSQAGVQLQQLGLCPAPSPLAALARPPVPAWPPLAASTTGSHPLVCPVRVLLVASEVSRAPGASLSSRHSSLSLAHPTMPRAARWMQGGHRTTAIVAAERHGRGMVQTALRFDLARPHPHQLQLRLTWTCWAWISAAPCPPPPRLLPRLHPHLAVC